MFASQTRRAGYVIVGQFDFVVLENSLYNQAMTKPTKAFDELLEQLKELLPKLQDQYHVQSLEVFGSYVRGNEKKDSDLDLLVVFDKIPTLFKFVELENFLSDHLGLKVDLVMKDSLKPTIGKRILEEAQSI